MIFQSGHLWHRFRRFCGWLYIFYQTIVCSFAAPDLPADDARILRLDVPAFVQPGATFSATVVVRNSGRNEWKESYQLCGQNPFDSNVWRKEGRVPLASYPISSGEEVIVTFSCVAPVTIGSYPFVWQMTGENGEPFGEKARQTIVVTSTPKRDATRTMPQYSVRVWQAEDGLPQNSVQALAQTRDGYLWVATQKGLARFDGVRFTTVSLGDAPELANPFIYALSESRDGSLWIGTFNAGLVRMKNGVCTRYTVADGLAANAVRSIYESRDGTLWIGTTNGLSRFHDGKFSNLTTADGLRNGSVRGICEDEGVLWIATEAGAYQMIEEKIGSPFDLGHGMPDVTFRSLFWDGKNTVWFGTLNGLAFRRNGQQNYFTKAEGLADNVVNAIYEDRRGNLWVGTYGGLCRLNSGQWNVETGPDGLPFDLVSSIIEDREGNIWVGAKDGLARLQIRHFTTFTQQQGLTHNNIISVCEDRAGVLWIATWGGGIDFLKDGKFSPFVPSRTPLYNLALSLHEDRNGDLWAGMDYTGGLYRWRGDKVTHFGHEEGLPSAAIRVIYSDRSNRLWLGTSRGLALYEGGKFVQFTTDDGLPGNTVRALLEDAEGNLWIGTNEGLSRHKDGKFTNFTTQNGLSRNAILALHEDADRDLWIGTASGGLNRLSKGRFIFYGSREGLFRDDIHEILEDEHGYFWMTCREGIFRVAKSDFDRLDSKKITQLHCDVYGKRDGLVSIDCNNVAKPAGWKGHDGRLWFATAKGLSVVDSRADLKPNELPPPVVIEEVVSDKKVQRLKFKGQSQELHAPGTTLSFEPDTLNLSPGRGELEFHYTALSFTAPEKNRFSYKLDGVDSDWVEAGTRHVAYYNNIEPGDYTFHVIACNNDGVWNSFGTKVKLTLQPHIWQTWWFQSLVGFSAIVLIGGVVRSVTRKKMQREVQLLEQQHAIEKERARIAQDMHDDLGARLTAILIHSDYAGDYQRSVPEIQQSVQTISRSTRELICDLDALVWAVNPGNDSLRSLIGYICEYVEMFLSATSIRYRLDIPQNLPETTLSSETRHHLFLVVKEALSNVVKHSDATEVRLGIKIHEQCLDLLIEDNGKGISKVSRTSSGNGLRNMEERMKNIGGICAITSEPGEGTRIAFQITIGGGASKVIDF